MKVIKDKYIKKDDFFKLNRLFDVSRDEIEKDWLIYKDQRNYLKEQGRIKSEMQKSRCPSHR
jgi:hypothetical protein